MSKYRDLLTQARLLQPQPLTPNALKRMLKLGSWPFAKRLFDELQKPTLNDHILKAPVFKVPSAVSTNITELVQDAFVAGVEFGKRISSGR